MACYDTDRPAVKEVQVGAMHPLQIWLHRLGICKVSDKRADQPIKKCATPCRIHVFTLLNCCGWKQLVSKNVCICKMFLQCHRANYAIKQQFCGPDKVAFHAYTHTCTQYNTELYIYVHTCTHTGRRYTHRVHGLTMDLHSDDPI